MHQYEFKIEGNKGDPYTTEVLQLFFDFLFMKLPTTSANNTRF
jgi:hypothetical protein